MAPEYARRLVHASGAVVPAAYLVGLLTWSQVRLIVVGGLVLTAALEAARLYGGHEHPIFDHLAREYEWESVAGYALYVFSGTVVVLAFDPQVAVPALFMLTIADPISGLVSTGELRPVKRPRVLAVMFLTCFLLAHPFVPVPAAAAGALGATLADGVKPVVRGHVVDDNLTIPVVAGVAMWALLAVG